MSYLIYWHPVCLSFSKNQLEGRPFCPMSQFPFPVSDIELLSWINCFFQQSVTKLYFSFNKTILFSLFS